MNVVLLTIGCTMAVLSTEIVVDVKPIEELHERMIARQLRYKSATGRVELKIVKFSKTPAEPILLDKPVVSFHKRFQIWQTPKSYRNNFFAIVPNPNDLASGYEQIICQNCEKKDYLIKFTAHPTIGMEFSENIDDKRRISGQGYDLRTIAIIAVDFPNSNTCHESYMKAKLRTTIGSVPAHEMHEVKMDDRGRVIEHISTHKTYQYKQSVRFIYINDEPYLSEVTTKRPDGHLYEGRYKYLDYRKAGNTGHYPGIISDESLVDGIVTSASTTTISEVVYDATIPDEIFSFKTMQGLNGKLVFNTQNGIVHRYVDGVMVDADEYEQRSRRNRETPSLPEPVGIAPDGRRTWHYVAAALLCSVIAVVFLRRALRR